MAHREHSEHEHAHAPGCGHEPIRHGDHDDYIHDGHRHAAHEGHWDEHRAGGAGESSAGGADALGVSRDDSGAAASTWASGGADRPEDRDDVGGG